MPLQIVMDRSGDARYHFNEDDDAAVARAQQRFDSLMRNGFTAARRVSPGEVERIRSFDRRTEETLFFPQLVGG
ncbi:hypothetical protein JJB98_27685 [Bradyrhizobium diazoefficiens]|nr:hypothetical protein [Bradyrhizobium diazoefficiens]QQO23451.1 hypothetical protein JJB98_27685 [Bradyrhizobium diazoefficiens]